MTMLENIITLWPRFSNYILIYLPLFGKAGWLHFTRFLIGFISYDGSKNLTGLNHGSFDQRHLSNLSRFVGESHWDEEKMEQLRYEDLNRRVRCYIENEKQHGRELKLYLAIDDTNNPKRGGQAFSVSYQYSHLARGTILCQCFVTAVLCVGDWCIPIAYKFYLREEDCKKTGQPFVSKTELARRIIAEFCPPCRATTYVVVDSWYTCEALIKQTKKRGFIFVGGLMSNRGLKLTEDESYTQVSSYASKLKANAYQTVTVGKQRYRLCGVKGSLHGGIRGKIIFSHPLGKTGLRQTRYFFSTLEDASTSLIMEGYSKRWAVEVFHHKIKQMLGLSDGQCLSKQSIRRMLVMLMVAYSYLLTEQMEHSRDYTASKTKGKGVPTLEEVQRRHKQHYHQGLVEWAFKQGAAGADLNTVLSQIAA